MATSDREWQRIADGLRSFKEKQRAQWGGVDEWLMARYISNNCTTEEKQRVEAARRAFSHLDEILAVVARVMKLPVPSLSDTSPTETVSLDLSDDNPAQGEQVVAPAGELQRTAVPRDERRSSVASLAFREMMGRVRAGDPAAAAELVRQYEGEIRRVIRIRLDARLGSVLDSMDICNSVLGNFFVRVAAGQFDLQDPTQLLKLLVTMARNKLLDHARRPDPRPIQAEEEHLAVAPGRDETPSQIVAYEEMLQKMRDNLSEEERYLAEQRALGREWSDLATELGIAAETLRRKLSRAVDRVSKELGLDEVEA
jgi:RNA polymerase sigma-70 factor (ECF subfamily)